MLFARVYFPFALGYAISYFYRNANAIIQSNLVDELGLGPADLAVSYTHLTLPTTPYV